MSKVKRLVLDVLKPHTPNAVEFATAIADQGSKYMVTLTVVGVDEKTEGVTLMVEGEDIQVDSLSATIADMGGSIHSIDEATVVSNTEE
jgi:hypothetical protein